MSTTFELQISCVHFGVISLKPKYTRKACSNYPPSNHPNSPCSHYLPPLLTLHIIIPAHLPTYTCTPITHSITLYPPLHYSELHCTALHCTALHCTALHCTALHCTVFKEKLEAPNLSRFTTSIILLYIHRSRSCFIRPLISISPISLAPLPLTFLAPLSLTFLAPLSLLSLAPLLLLLLAVLSLSPPRLY